MEPVPFQRLSVYQTKARLYIVGYCKLRGTAALLKAGGGGAGLRQLLGPGLCWNSSNRPLSKQEPTQLDVAEVAGGYSLAEVRTMLGQIHSANAHLGGLQLVTHCCGVIGCFRFTETFYLLLVTRKARVGLMPGGHRVYTVAATALVPLHPGYAAAGGGPSSAAEKRYVKLLMGMDLTKHFYFSYTYPLAHTLQTNCRAAAAAAAAAFRQQQGPLHDVGAMDPDPGAGPSSSAGGSVYDSMFTWNAYLTSALRRALGGNERWTVPLIHGFWEQRRLSIYGRPLTLTLIARRSRHFAGTRFRKRGINDGGKVANEVETEQVVDAGMDYRTRTPLLSSVVQVRGSVPLFWSQQLSALSPKPEILLQQFDPLYEVTQAHFEDLEARYGAPVVTLNLLKSKERRPRETLLRRELAAAIAQLNAARGRGRPHIVYIPWDFSKHAKQSGANLLGELLAITRLALDMTGLFVHNPAAPVARRALAGAGSAAAAAAAAAAGASGAGGMSPGLVGAARGKGRVGLMRSAGEVGSSMHLAAAAEAAAAAVHARNSAATSVATAAAAAAAAARAEAAAVDAAFPTLADCDGSAVQPGSATAVIRAAVTAAAERAAGGGSSGGGGVRSPNSTLAGYHPSHGHTNNHYLHPLAHSHSHLRTSQRALPRHSSGGGGGGGGGSGRSSFQASRASVAAAAAASAAANAAAAVYGVQWQTGALRTNCIDCLDRTNVAQFAFGLVAFGRQLFKLGLHDLREVDADSSAAFTLMALYEAMGHVISLQYGGSEAHTVFFQRKKGEWEATTQSKDMLTSIRRLYSNTYTDAEKQDAINLFLGNFVPRPGQPHLWQLDTDQYLHSETTQRAPPLPLTAAAAAASGAGTSASGAVQGGGMRGSGFGGAAAVAAQPQLPTSHSAIDRAPSAAMAAAAVAEEGDVTPTAAGGEAWPPPPLAATISVPFRRHPSDRSGDGGGGLSESGGPGNPPGFLSLPGERPPPLDLSSSDDDDGAGSTRPYHAGPPGGAADAAAAASTAAAVAYAAASSSAIPFHRAPSSGGFLASLLPSFSGPSGSRAGGGGAGGGGGGGVGLFERVVSAVLAPGGAGAAARAAAAGVAGAAPGGGGGPKTAAQLLLSFDSALSRPINQVWPIRLHNEEDRQGRLTWAAVQSAFSFFWPKGPGAGEAGAAAHARANYRLDDAPRPAPLNRATSARLPPTPSGPASPTSRPALPPSGLSSIAPTPEPSRHGGNALSAGGGAGAGGVGGSTLRRTTTQGIAPAGGVTSEGGGAAGPTLVMSESGQAVAQLTSQSGAAPAPGSPDVTWDGAYGGTGLYSGAGRTASRNLGQLLDAMVDLDHTDEHMLDHGGSACRTVADTIPRLGDGDGNVGGAGGAAASAAGRVISLTLTNGGGGGTDGDDEDGVYYYSVGDAADAAAAAAAEGTGGSAKGGGVLGLIRPRGGAQPAGKQPPGPAPGPPAAIPVLNDFIEVAGPPAPGGRGAMADLQGLGPAAQRRAAAEAAARSREEERQRKLLTAGLEVSDLLGLGPEDLGLNWELQPWWGLEPRPSYTPRPYEPHPSRLRAAREAQAAAAAREPRAQVQPPKAAEAGEEEGPGEEGVRAEAVAPSPGPHAPSPSVPYVPPPYGLLQQKQQVEATAFLHYDVANAHARAKFGEFLAALPEPYGLAGEERRRELDVYGSYCYIEGR
ncbi:hypothetical protein HYH03_016195 [Edaphochlamys debaryana]|uniref:SAC domain-containing protein n=1 Tax=Edaphochlamys debaryana TaxID=47281 RepID=A0A835XKE8_9CHLO|nr:hypothetical protein HYH03_016195 [Edaphochlamys debaryana]|eukprot:KAG2485099.1 hypothetical protein HYH03_016195 [Edaphochlamys debaryana]